MVISDYPRIRNEFGTECMLNYENLPTTPCKAITVREKITFGFILSVQIRTVDLHIGRN